MSYNLRLRRVAYDNIAVGSATGRERTKGTNTTPLLANETFQAGTAAVRTTDCLDHIITATGGKTTAFVNETIINTN
ncbi:MAG: hypothetical protein MUF84_12105 [Anaerolineae bacterium]|nr:hypothetical protein [Anaerolineae bacterium]